MQGINTINIRLGEEIDPNVKKMLRDMRIDMPGSDIIRDDSEYIIYNIPIESTDEKIDDIMMILHNMALTAHKEAVQSLITNNRVLAEDIIGREREMLRIYRKLIRYITLCSINPVFLAKNPVKDNRELLAYVLASRDLNRIVYHSIYIARHYLGMNGIFTRSDILSLIERESNIAYEMQKSAIEAFIHGDFTKVVETSSRVSDVQRLEEEISINVIKSVEDVKEATALMLIGREIRRIAGYSVAIADAAANRILFIE
jgi:phosphate uptake regulator